MGKLIAILIGWIAYGLSGAILGGILGYFFDKAFRSRSRYNPEQRAKIEQTFFDTVFPLLGYIAKADGRVSEDEISGTEELMARMALNDHARQQAITLFKQGVAADFSVDDLVRHFVHTCGNHANFKQIILVYLISIAFADGFLHEAEERILAQVANDLGYSRFAFNHLVGMVKAQNYFYQRQKGSEQSSQAYTPQQNELDVAYAALGVKSTVTDGELKRAYRKLMSQYHPDKLAGSGVPEDVVKVATEKAQEIQTAYELIKKQRRS